MRSRPRLRASLDAVRGLAPARVAAQRHERGLRRYLSADKGEGKLLMLGVGKGGWWMLRPAGGVSGPLAEDLGTDRRLVPREADGKRQKDQRRPKTTNHPVVLWLRILARPACDRPLNSNGDRVAHRNGQFSRDPLGTTAKEPVTGEGLTSPPPSPQTTRAR